MMKSMTAYGRAKKGKWTVEVHSVNRKMLDTNIFLPKGLLSLDIDLRKQVAESVQRGQVTLRIGFESSEAVNELSTLQSLQKKWNTIASKLKLAPPTLEFLTKQMEETAPISATKEMKLELSKVVEEALEEFLVMREKEGAALAKDFLLRLKNIDADLKKIAKRAPLLQEKLRTKILQDGVVSTEKIDITEEITRLNSHMEQYLELMRSKEKAVGRTLDFLAQEMGREIGTLAAKAADTEISRLAIGIKSEIEKIREQVQNIE